MPYERQLKERQVYKTLSICVELIKSDVNLKFRLKVSSNVLYTVILFGHFYHLIRESFPIQKWPIFSQFSVFWDFFPKIFSRFSQMESPTSKGLLENLIQFIIKTRNGKGSF